MTLLRHPLRVALFMLMAAAVFPAAAQTTQGVFTGGDAGEGLDLQGDIVLASHMGGDPFLYEVGEARFMPDSGLTLTGADEIINDWATADFGPTDNDQGLRHVMRSIRHNGREHGTMTLSADRRLTIGETYKVQLLFVESGPAPRRFDISVGGVTALPAFTLQAATDPPSAIVVTHVFVATDRDLTVTLDGANIPDEAGVDTNPILSALTLERCTPFTTVVTNTNDSGPGSLRQAIADAAGCPATITFLPALNNQSITLTSGQLEITGPGLMIIDASPMQAGVAISGNDTSRVLHTGPGTQVRLTKLAPWHGTGQPSPGAFNDGGALLNEGTLVLDRCTIFQNTVDNTTRGGGLYNKGTATLTGCTITQNPGDPFGNAGRGGGIFNDTAGHLTLTGCTLYNNHAFVGGGLENFGTAVLNGCTIFGNGSYTDGGGVTNHGTATFTHCTFAGNVAENSGAALSNDGAATLTGCTLTGNSISYSRGSPRGGGITHTSMAALSDLTLTHCLIAGNTSTDSGTGPDVFAASPVTASWCLIGDGRESGILHAVNGNKVGGGALPVIPARLGPLDYNGGTVLTFLPLYGSAAIDAGNPNVFPAIGVTDQRGDRRRRGASQDIGAVETMPDLSSVRLILFRPSGGIQNLQVMLPVDVGPLFAQTSTDLINWTTAVLGDTGISGLFTVPFNPAEKKRFYRLAEPP